MRRGVGQFGPRRLECANVSAGRSPTLRAFLALDFDAAARRVLAAHLNRLRAMPWANDVRWVRPDNLHLTLRFLGEITPARATHYAERFGAGLANVPHLAELKLEVTSPRFFPAPSRPRVIACLVSPHPTLAMLAALAESCAVGIGLTAESRPFNGHITLGRARDAFPCHATLPNDDAITPMQPTAITLYESKLLPSGPIYTALRSFSLCSQL